MVTIGYTILILCVLLTVLAIAKGLIHINEIDKELDKRIDEMLAGEKHKNKRS